MNKMINKRQAGYTAVEAMVCVLGLAFLVGMGFAVYAVVHFVCKFW